MTSAKAASWVVPRTALLNRLAAATEPVIAIVAPAGSGKTVLLSSWMAQLGPAVRVASLSVDRDERDAQRFWLSVAQELSLAGARVEVPAPAPQFDARQLVDRLAEDIAHLDEGVLLAIDDLHELKSPEAIAALERFIERRPANLRLVLAMRHDMALGLHRLRVAGDLLELRAADMDFALDETRALLAASGINLAEDDVQLLHERTEGWAAGLRLAALSLSGVPDPHHLVAQFSGSERTVADYLLAEVLSRQSDDVRQLLLRTSIVDRVNSSLADALTGKPGSGPILLQLERDGVFVVPSSGDRTWLRYHQLFADLLRLELRRTHPEEVVPLHLAAAGWYEAHGMIIEAIRQTQAAEDWTAATHLLADNVLALALDGHSDTIGALLRTFPADRTMDPERALVTAGYELIRGSLNDAAAYADTAERLASEVDPQRRARFNTSLIVAKSAIARRRGDQQLVAAEMAQLLDAEGANQPEPALNNDARAVALLDAGIVELWSSQIDDAERHLNEGLALANRIGRPFLTIGFLGHLALTAANRSLALQRQRAEEAIAVAEAHGWLSEPISAVPLATMGMVSAAQARFADARVWAARAASALQADVEPATAVMVRYTDGLIEAGEGRLGPAIEAFREAERHESFLLTRHVLTADARSLLVHVLLRCGDLEGARKTVTSLTSQERDGVEGRVALADLALHESDARAARVALAPALDGQVRHVRPATPIYALLLDAQARAQLNDAKGAQDSIEKALDIAEPESRILPFVILSVTDQLSAHPRHMTSHAAFLTDILDVLAGRSLDGRPISADVLDPLSESELRVLRYLPSNLSASEIADVLYVSTSTVKTHMRHIYEKLNVHRRSEAVDRARQAGLLAASTRGRG